MCERPTSRGLALCTPCGRSLDKADLTTYAVIEWAAKRAWRFARRKAHADTLPADLTQHPAYRAGVEAGAEAAAQIVERRGANEPSFGSIGRVGLNEIAATIRALLDTKAVRDDE